jgi:hypothetical protein
VRSTDDTDPEIVFDDERMIIPDRSADDSDAGWGERPEPVDDARLLDERPPHWQ